MASYPFIVEAAQAGFSRMTQKIPRRDIVTYSNGHDTIAIKLGNANQVLDVNINGRPHAVRGTTGVLRWFDAKRRKAVRAIVDDAAQ